MRYIAIYDQRFAFQVANTRMMTQITFCFPMNKHFTAFWVRGPSLSGAEKTRCLSTEICPTLLWIWTQYACDLHTSVMANDGSSIKHILPSISFRGIPGLDMGSLTSSDISTPAGSLDDLGTVYFVDASGGKHIAKIVGK